MRDFRVVWLCSAFGSIGQRDAAEICQGNHFLTLQNDDRPISAPMLPQRDICLAHFRARSVDQMTKKCALGILSRLGTGGRSGYYGKMWKAMTSGTIDLLRSPIWRAIVWIRAGMRLKH
jgi:hypothetical protein